MKIHGLLLLKKCLCLVLALVLMIGISMVTVFADTESEIDGTETVDTAAETIILGDVNTDGGVDIFDVTHIQCYVAKMTGEDDIELKAADVDADNDVTIFDATMIQRYIAKLSCPDGIGQPIASDQTEPTFNEEQYELPVLA